MLLNHGFRDGRDNGPNPYNGHRYTVRYMIQKSDHETVRFRDVISMISVIHFTFVNHADLWTTLTLCYLYPVQI